MKSNRTLSALRAVACAASAAVLLAPAGPAHAEDIDIYANGTTGGAANVLFFIDNTSNWSASNQAWSAANTYTVCMSKTGALAASCQAAVEGVFYYGKASSSSGGPKRPWETGFNSRKDDQTLTQGQVELRSLRYVLNSLVCSGTSTLKVNVGLMLWNVAGTVRSNGDVSGYIRHNVQPLAGTATTAGSTCKSLIDDLNTIDASITTPDFKGPSSADYGSAMFEAFKYFGGWTNPTLAATSTAGSPVGAMGYGPIRYSKATSLEDASAFTDSGKTTYAGPNNGGQNCGKNYLVLIGNQYPNAEPNAGPARFQGLNYTPTQLPADVTRYADEWSQFLANTDVNAASDVQNIGTYALNVYNTKFDSSQAKLLKSMAENGGVGTSGYMEVGGDLGQLVADFSKILISVSAVDSVFTATTLPVSTTTQGSYLNQLYIGMFRPDAGAAPRWMGNLKQYQLGLDTSGNLQVESVDGSAALLASTGYFSPLATSFWTADSVFFANKKSGTPLSSSDSPDGQIVEKGGVAQVLRTANLTNSTARKVYTLPATPSGTPLLSATPFDTTNSALTSYGFSSDQIKWIRGENNIDSAASGSEFFGSTKDSSGTVTSLTTGSARPSIHGDILHSRPVALNYGSGRVVVYYGSNDGFLHAVDGRQATTAGGGTELWSFIAPEHYGMLMRLHDDTPQLWLPVTDSSGNTTTKVVATAQKKDYAMDGPIGVFAEYSSAGVVQKATIFATMRRGGSAVYAFDVSDPTAPSLKWKVSNKSSDFSNLGQTWSTPRAVLFPSSKLDYPVVLMGGGYDPGEDNNPATSTGVGKGIYVLNANTGELLKHLDTDAAVPGDVTVVDTNSDGVYDRGYVADVHGNVYRISMTDDQGAFTEPSNWTIKKIAALGGKVFFAPDVIPTRSFIAVMVGTGDREKPLMTSTSDNFFVLKDTLIGTTDRTTVLTKSDLTRVGLVDNTTQQITNTVSPVDDPEGCYLQLATNGEKVVNQPTSVSGATYFGTNRPTPSSTSCKGSLGEARSYQFPLFCGVPKSNALQGGGLPPSPVGGLVQITNADGSTGLVNFIIGSGMSSTKSSLEAWQPHSPIPNKRKRTYWHVENQNR